MTEKQKKIRTILNKYSSEDLLFTLHECVDILAPVEPSEMAEMECVSKRTILDRIKDNKYMIFNFINRRFPIINDHLK